MPNKMVDGFADALDAVAANMETAGFGKKPVVGYVAHVKAMAADMRAQADSSAELPTGMKIDAMRAFGDHLSAGLDHSSAVRTDLPPQIARLFASASLPNPPAGKKLDLGEANALLNRAGITDTVERIARKTEMGRAGLLTEA